MISDAIEKIGFKVLKKRESFFIKGMTCASCVSRVEKKLSGLKGILSVQVNLAQEKVLIDQISSISGVKEFQSALSDIDMFTIVKNKNNGCDIIIGYSSTNTNRVNIPVNCDMCNVEKPITFNANLFKEVLVANRECSSAVLEVSNEGLARVNFKVDDYDSTYYVVAMQDID